MTTFLYFLLGCFVVGFVWEILSEILPPLFEVIFKIIGACIGFYILFSLAGWILLLCGVQDSFIISTSCKFVFGILLYFIVRNQEDNYSWLIMFRWTILGYLVGVWFGGEMWTALVGFLWGLCTYMDSKS